MFAYLLVNFQKSSDEENYEELNTLFTVLYGFA